MPVNAHTDPLFFTSLSLTDQYLVKDFPPPTSPSSFTLRMRCVFSGMPGFHYNTVEKQLAGRSGASQRSCRSVRSSRTHCFGSALQWGGQGREGVTLLTESHKTDLRQIDHGDEGRGQEDDT